MQLGPDQEGGNATLVLVVGGQCLVAAPDAENEIRFLRDVGKNIFKVQAFLDFGGFDFGDFRFNAVYNSILFSSPLVLLSNLDLLGFCFRGFIFVLPH